jgi:hypothetical protein
MTYCTDCDHNPCVCGLDGNDEDLDEVDRLNAGLPDNSDRDDSNPVDLAVEEWREIYSDPDYEDMEP